MANGTMRNLLGIQPPDAAVAKWHVSPAVDVSAYAFSWVPYLLPALFFTKDAPVFFVFLLISGALTEVHRHLSFPYVYGDREVLSVYPLRFVLFPLVLLALLVFTPYLARAKWTMSTAEVASLYAHVVVLVQLLKMDGRDHEPGWRTLLPLLALGWGVPMGLVAVGLRPDVLGYGLWGFLGAAGLSIALAASPWRTRGPAEDEPRIVAPYLVLALAIAAGVWGPGVDASNGGFRPRTVLNSIATLGFLWNIWHVYAQKYGILRMYDAKAGDPERTPGWSDRWLVFAWVPLYFSWVGPTQAAMWRRKLSRGGAVLDAAIDLFTAAMPVAVPLSIAALVAAHVVWLVQERRVHGLRNRPRLVMALGTTLLSAAFVAFDFWIAFAAFAFSHAVEYIVFLWAYMRKKYAQPLPHAPLLQRALRRPWLAYGVFFIGLGLFFTLSARWGRSIASDSERLVWFGTPASTWLFWWMLFQSLTHFYWDGFLWKMRRKTVRAHL